MHRFHLAPLCLVLFAGCGANPDSNGANATSAPNVNFPAPMPVATMAPASVAPATSAAEDTYTKMVESTIQGSYSSPSLLPHPQATTEVDAASAKLEQAIQAYQACPVPPKYTKLDGLFRESLTQQRQYLSDLRQNLTSPGKGFDQQAAQCSRQIGELEKKFNDEMDALTGHIAH